MNHWEHLTQVPEDVRKTMSTAFIPWEKQDLGIESMIDLAIHAPKVTEIACRIVRSSANSIRVPELVVIVSTAHPAISKRSVFRAVSLFVGLCERHVQRLYYSEKKTHVF